MSGKKDKPKRKYTKRNTKSPEKQLTEKEYKALKEQFNSFQETLERINPKPKAGRPTKKNKGVEEKILNALGLGLSYSSAAKYAEITEVTLRKWREEDKNFSSDCEKARAKPMIFYSTKLYERAVNNNLTAIIFWLKSRTEEFQERKYEIFQDGGEYNADETFL